MGELLKILPLITFIAAALMIWLNLVILNKTAKTKEETLTLVRAEFKLALDEMEERQAVRNREERVLTKDQLQVLKTELILMLKNIELKIDYSGYTRRDMRDMKGSRDIDQP